MQGKGQDEKLSPKDPEDKRAGGEDQAGTEAREREESSDDQFENKAEEILEAERGVAHTWTDDSEACVTDQEEVRSEVKKGEQRSAPERSVEGQIEEEEPGLDEADGEKLAGDEAPSEENETGEDKIGENGT